MRGVAVAVVSLASVFASFGQTPAGTLVRFEDLQPLALPVAAPDALATLEYAPDAETVFAFALDANGDDARDYLLGSDGGALCGTGGCPYVLVDGRTGAELGYFFGTVAILRRKDNGYAVIQVLSKRDIDSSALETYAYTDGEYRVTASALLDASGVAAWMNGLGPSQR